MTVKVAEAMHARPHKASDGINAVKTRRTVEKCCWFTIGLVLCLLAVYLPVVSRAGVLFTNIVDQQVQSHRFPDVVEALLTHWKNVTRLHSRSLASYNPASTAAIIQNVGISTSIDYCYCKMKFDGTLVKVVDDLSQHCNNSGTSQVVIQRAHIYSIVFNELLSKVNASSLNPFEFYIDVTPGTRNNVNLFKHLRLPVLSFSRHPYDRHTLPLPDVYMVMGVLGAPLNLSTHFPHYKNFIKDMYSIYGRTTWAYPWQDKISKVVFRGTCCATIASDDVNPHAREELRPDLCSLYNSHSLFDIGLSISASACTSPGSANSTLCSKCRACFEKPRLSRVEQVKYKYQLVVDGQAATNDASVWKLRSNSAVIRLRPNGWHVPMYQQFYDPLFHPYQHFLPSDLDNLLHTIHWCEDHPKGCEDMAAAAAVLIESVLRKDVLDGYILGVFLYMHDSVFKRVR